MKEFYLKSKANRESLRKVSFVRRAALTSYKVHEYHAAAQRRDQVWLTGSTLGTADWDWGRSALSEAEYIYLSYLRLA